MGVHHEDVLMKLFMVLLEGDVRKSYRRLPHSAIYSLNIFHTRFCEYFKCMYLVGLLDFDCCKDCNDNNLENQYVDNGKESRMHNEFEIESNIDEPNS